MEKEKNQKRRAVKTILAVLFLLEMFLSGLLFLFFSIIPYSNIVLAVVGQNNATVLSLINIGNSFPEILNVTINDENSIDLTPNSTTTITILAIIRDYSGEGDIDRVTSEFFDSSASFYGDIDDNNLHYSNSTCLIDTSYGDANEVNATCTFEIEYYANNATWNATIWVNDSLNSQSTDSKTETINTLLALALPDSIDYGTINATIVSDEQTANVTNVGNVMMNLSLSGYGASVNDGLAMNCTLGSTKNISIEYEKYNLNTSIAGALNLTEFESNYTNLTSNVVVRRFDLNYRTNDAAPSLDEVNSTYWRIYVPLGVAGTCSGNIVFGAAQSGGS